MGSATAKQDRQLGEKKEPSGGGKRIAPERFRVAPQAILSVTDHSGRVHPWATSLPTSSWPSGNPNQRRPSVTNLLDEYSGLSGEWISAILGWRKELPLVRLAEKEVERSRKKHDFETSSRR